jgi:hypothetical protein
MKCRKSLECHSSAVGKPEDMRKIMRSKWEDITKIGVEYLKGKAIPVTCREGP